MALVGAGNSAGQAAVYLAEPGRQGLAAGARRRPRGEHVALPGRPHRGAAQRRGADRRREVTALEGQDGMLEAVRWRDRDRRRRRAAPSATCSCSSAPSRTPTGCRARGVALDAKGFVLTGADADRRAARWRPAGTASSPSATSARARSSASPPPSAKARRWSPLFTRTWRPAPERHCGLISLA